SLVEQKLDTAFGCILRAGFNSLIRVISLFRVQIHLPVRLISIMGRRLRSFLLLVLSAQAFGSGLGSYEKLVVADAPGAARAGVRVTYLGTNGYQFEFRGHALLVDPYFSRVDLLSAALGSRIQPNASRVNDGLRHLASGNHRTDAILVTHGHFDHLLDVPG